MAKMCFEVNDNTIKGFKKLSSAITFTKMGHLAVNLIMED